jgi:hypothetical protein
MHPKVDPGALLLAVLTAAFAPLTETGPWDKMNTIVAGVVLLLVIAFTWPRNTLLAGDGTGGRTGPSYDNLTLFAQATAYGLVCAIAVAWPVQRILGAPTECPFIPPDEPPGTCDREMDDLASDASYIALGIGAVLTVVLFLALKSQMSRLANRAL